jgi:hypothetical protein
MGYFSLMIMELNIATLARRNMLLSTEWLALDPCFLPIEIRLFQPNVLSCSCGIPIYANAITTTCKQCSNCVPLRINPRLVGALIDESGAVACGGLVWSDAAWEQLLGRTAEELTQASKEVLGYLEHRLLFLRVTLLFGWSEELGKLCVCKVETF